MSNINIALSKKIKKVKYSSTAKPLYADRAQNAQSIVLKIPDVADRLKNCLNKFS